MGVEKLLLSKMLVAGSNRRIYTVDRHAGVVLAGLSSDARQLALRAQEECASYKGNFAVPMPPRVLADHMAMYMHAYTCYWHLRVFGASMIIAAYDDVKETHELYMAEPSGLCNVSRSCRCLLQGARAECVLVPRVGHSAVSGMYATVGPRRALCRNLTRSACVCHSRADALV